jgi:hypothetical protein
LIDKRWINLCFSWEIVFFLNKGRTSLKPEDESHEQSNERKHEPDGEDEAQPESEIEPEESPKSESKRASTIFESNRTRHAFRVAFLFSSYGSYFTNESENETAPLDEHFFNGRARAGNVSDSGAFFCEGASAGNSKGAAGLVAARRQNLRTRL